MNKIIKNKNKMRMFNKTQKYENSLTEIEYFDYCNNKKFNFLKINNAIVNNAEITNLSLFLFSDVKELDGFKNEHNREFKQTKSHNKLTGNGKELKLVISYIEREENGNLFLDDYIVMTKEANGDIYVNEGKLSSDEVNSLKEFFNKIDRL